MAHITGGGITENLPRILPPGTQAVVDRSAWRVPAIFEWLQQAGEVPDDDMLQDVQHGSRADRRGGGERRGQRAARSRAAGETARRLSASSAVATAASSTPDASRRHPIARWTRRQSHYRRADLGTRQQPAGAHRRRGGWSARCPHRDRHLEPGRAPPDWRVRRRRVSRRWCWTIAVSRRVTSSTAPLRSELLQPRRPAGLPGRVHAAGGRAAARRLPQRDSRTSTRRSCRRSRGSRRSVRRSTTA